MTCKATEVPKAYNNTFTNSNAQYGTLYVPAESLNKYKIAEGWRDWKFIEPIADMPAKGDTVYITITDTIYLEKIIEVHDTIYIYDDTRSEIMLPSGDAITLYITNGVVNIEDAPMNSLITVYTVDGEMYEASRVKEKVTSFTLPRNSIYIIKVGDKTFKVKI